MVLKGIVIDIVLLLAVGGATVTNVAAFVLITAVGVELIVTVESLTTETTLGVTSETTLVNGSRFVVARLLVLAQLRCSKELMLVCKDLFVASA